MSKYCNYKIQNRRIVKGKRQYLVCFTNFVKIWILEKEIPNKKEIQVFEEELENHIHPVGRWEGLRPLRIVGSTILNDEMWFLMEFLGIDTRFPVRSFIANKICPDLVIQYYAKILVFGDLGEPKQEKSSFFK